MQVPRSTRARVLLLALPVLLVLAVGVGSAFAAIPNPGDGKYYACLVRSTGAVRVINFPKVRTCPKGQKLISWNVQGPAAAQGAQGPQGAPGPAGATGITKITLTTVTANSVIPIGTSGSVVATCPAGKIVGGGHGLQLGNVISVNFVKSGLVPNSAIDWVVEAYNGGGGPATITAYAICMTTDPGTVIATASKSKVAKRHGK